MKHREDQRAKNYSVLLLVNMDGASSIAGEISGKKCELDTSWT